MTIFLVLSGLLFISVGFVLMATLVFAIPGIVLMFLGLFMIITGAFWRLSRK